MIVRSAPDTRFERHGADLWHDATLTLVDAVLGTSLDVPTLEDQTTVTVPPGTQPDTVLHLPGKGLPIYDQDERGNLYLRLRIQVPERLTDEERQLYERLHALQQNKR